MKNVLLDFDLIIKAQYNNTCKTGIYYTQYNLIKELLENYSDKFNLLAFSYYDEDFFYKTINNFLPELKNVKYYNIFSKSERINNLLKVKIKELKKIKSNKGPILKSFLVGEILFLKLIKVFIPKFKSKKFLKNIDIYQSFFDEIPESIRKNNNIKKFIIVHDILPHTNPEYLNIKKTNKIKLNFDKKINKIDINTIIFTDSEYTKKELLKYFPKFKKDNIITNLLASDSNKYYKLENIDKNQKNKTLEKYKIPTNKKYILSLCSLNKRKNLAFLVESFVEFLDKSSGVQDLNLVLAGPKGWLMDEMFKSIDKAEKYKDKIIVTGFIDDNDINIIYNSAFMFVFPSLAEGFGLPVLEAMQCGIPVISSNTTSLPEVYGNSAIGINPTNKEELVKAIFDIYNNENLRKKLSSIGLEQSKNFSWKKTIDNMVKEYLK